MLSAAAAAAAYNNCDIKCKKNSKPLLAPTELVTYYFIYGALGHTCKCCCMLSEKENSLLSELLAASDA